MIKRRVLFWGILTVVVMGVLYLPGHPLRWVRDVPPSSAFTWDIAAYQLERGLCGPTTEPRFRNGWKPGVGRYIFTMLGQGKSRGNQEAWRIRGRLWLAKDSSSTDALHGALDIDLSALFPDDSSIRVAIRSTDSRLPGVRMIHANGRSVLLTAGGPSALRFEVVQQGGDGFTGTWRTMDSLPRSGYFCAGWIDV